MVRRVAAILNPVSGRRNMLPVVREVGRALRRQDGELEILCTTRAGHATELAANIQDDTDAVLVVGGDGTVSEVINGLIHHPRPILILRTGTENLLARELGMPTEPYDIALTLLHGEPHCLDVGVINGQRFLAVTGMGFDAECVNRLAKTRQGHITHGDYFWPIWRTYWAHRFPILQVTIDGGTLFEGRGLAFVGLIARYSAGLRILGKAKHNDGLLDLCVFPCSTRRQLLRHAFRAFQGGHINHGGVIYRQGQRIRVTSPERVPIEIDGDEGGYLPAECSILPAAVQFLRFAIRAS